MNSQPMRGRLVPHRLRSNTSAFRWRRSVGSVDLRLEPGELGGRGFVWLVAADGKPATDSQRGSLFSPLQRAPRRDDTDAAFSN